MQRRKAFQLALWTAGGFLLTGGRCLAKTFLSEDQAKRVLMKGKSLKRVEVTLSKDQEKAIEKASKARVIKRELDVYKASDGSWFIIDHVIGKHEFIDYAVSLTNQGKVTGIEVLTYRETYGDEITNPKWRAQFYGRGPGAPLKVDKEIKNISGATLSCVHITVGINRLTQTWDKVLRYL
ncbi:FMN-binding protein [Luteolibacter sp. AS25]|uniref:FMN-binding protein n=1 Tax=Luteolibacter sp. AS25 TaxID=3135776 RepID=UPI00398AE3D5